MKEVKLGRPEKEFLEKKATVGSYSLKNKIIKNLGGENAARKKVKQLISEFEKSIESKMT